MTLIELMIGMLLGLVVLGAGTSAYLSSLQSQTVNLQLARLNQDVRTISELLGRDLRRAGFVTSRPDSYPNMLTSNPFTAPGADIRVLDYAGSTSSCILYSYNANDDEPPSVDSDEHFGFRLSSQGVVEMKTSGAVGDDCSEGDWLPATESDIEITSLIFAVEASPLRVLPAGTEVSACSEGDACLTVRSVTLVIEAASRQDSDITQRNEQVVHIRNDRFEKGS
jgi:type IV pilus assembly protein PilW